MKTYSEKLRDPRWQKKRLEILDRDNWTCQNCGDEKSTLHVHHLDYEKGLEPWDYEDEYLQTLCETCHEGETIERPAIEARLIKAIRLNLKSTFEMGFLESILECGEDSRQLILSLGFLGASRKWRKDFLRDVIQFIRNERGEEDLKIKSKQAIDDLPF